MLILSSVQIAARDGTDEVGGERQVFKWGFSERVRQAYIMNGFDLDNDSADDRNYVRVRTKLWCSYEPTDDLMLYAGLNNEHRHYFKPDVDFEIGEVIFENLYIKAKNIGGSPVTVIAGRQNMMHGEGFIFMDGGPLDGSRMGYFNALRVILEKGERSLEFHVLSNPERDEYLPRMNSRRQRLIEWDETGAGVYYTERSLRSADIEAYYLFKREEDDGNAFPKTDLHTIGARIEASPLERLVLTAEGAYQTGERGDNDRTGYGGYLYGTYRAPMGLAPELTAGVIYLSGDDRKTGEFEGWDPLYSRWPKWSELYIYTLVSEYGLPSYWSNLFAPHVGLGLKPCKRLTLLANAYFMRAAQAQECYETEDATVCPLPPIGTGEDRGLLTTLWIKWSFTKYLTGHLLWERFKPGDFYSEDNRETAHFLRWEFLFKY